MADRRPRAGWRVRAVDRTPVSLPVEGVIGDGATIDLQLQDVSPLGFKGRSLDIVRVGDTIDLEFPTIGEVPATVTWESGITFGGPFLRPISWRRVQQLLLGIRPAR